MGYALGEDLPVIGKLLGHSQVETTARYAHLVDESVRAVVARISGSIAAIVLPGYRPTGEGEVIMGSGGRQDG